MLHRSLPRFALCLSALAFVQYAEPACAAPLPSTVAAAGHLTIGINCNYPPAGYVGLDGQSTGYEVALAKRIADAAFPGGNGLQTQCVNDSNRIPFLQSGKVDMVLAALAWTPARAEQIEFSDPIWVSNLQLVVPNASTVNGYKDLAGKTVVTTTGSLYQTWLEKCTKATVVTAQSPADASSMLTQGRADVLAYIDVYSFNFAKHNTQYRLAGDLAAPAIQGVGLRKGNKELLDWTNGVIADLKSHDAFYQAFAAEVSNPAFAARYRPLVPGPEHDVKYINPADFACTE